MRTLPLFAALLALCAAVANGQTPARDRITLQGALSARSPMPVGTYLDAAPLQVTPRPVTGVVVFATSGPNPVQYEIDLTSTAIRDGYLRVYERESDSYPIWEGGVSYLDSTGMTRVSGWLAVRCNMLGAWLVDANTLVIDYEDDIAGGPGPFAAEGVHYRRHIYRLENRALSIEVIDLDSSVTARRNYSGVYYGRTASTEDPRIIQMQGALSIPLVRFLGVAGEQWFFGNTLDIAQSRSRRWFLPELAQSNPTATSIDFGMHCLGRYEPDSNGNISAPMRETITLCVSRQIEDCFIVSTQGASPYRDFLAQRTVVLFAERTTTWDEYIEHLDQYRDFGMDDLAIYMFHHWTSSAPDILGNTNVGPDWHPARDPGRFQAMIGHAALQGIPMGAYVAFSSFAPTSPSQYNVLNDFARQANGTINVAIQNPQLRLYGVAASAMHSQREHNLMQSDYGLSMGYVDVQTYSSPSGGADGQHLDLMATSPQPKTLKDGVREQKRWFDDARRVLGGPLLGEGSIGTKPSNLEWIWAGYVDSVQRVINTGAGMDAPMIPAGDPRAVTNWPVIPEYELRIPRAVAAHHGNGFYDRFFGPHDGAGFVVANGDPIFPLTEAALDRYRAYEITYGHTPYFMANGPGDGVGNLLLLPDMIKEHYLVNELSRRYYEQNLQEIRYQWTGQLRTFEEILAQTGTTDSFRDPRIQITYDSLVVYVNHSATNWPVAHPTLGTFSLPQDGWLAWDTADAFLAFSATAPGLAQRIDYCLAPGRWEMFDGRGSVLGYGGITTGAPGAPRRMQVRNFVHEKTIHELIQVTMPNGALTPSTLIVNGTPPTVTSLTIDGAPSSLRPGRWSGVRATVHYSNGARRDVTKLVTWSVSDPALATIESCGVIRGLGGVGNVQVMCSSFAGVSANPVPISFQF